MKQIGKNGNRSWKIKKKKTKEGNNKEIKGDNK